LSVTGLRGTVTLIDDPQIALPEAKRLSLRYHGPEKGEQQFRDVFSKQERVSIRLRIEHVTEYGFS
jgi:hypothetical protein